VLFPPQAQGWVEARKRCFLWRATAEGLQTRAKPTKARQDRQSSEGTVQAPLFCVSSCSAVSEERSFSTVLKRVGRERPQPVIAVERWARPAAGRNVMENATSTNVGSCLPECEVAVTGKSELTVPKTSRPVVEEIVSITDVVCRPLEPRQVRSRQC
jgi:hypothetical protein